MNHDSSSAGRTGEHGLLSPGHGRALAWISITIGIASGAILGTWSFDGPLAVPDSVGAYDSLARRLLRLGHIAFVALGMLHLLLLREWTAGRGVLARGAMAFGNAVLPTTLVVAAFVPPARWFLGVPATAVLLAVLLTARKAITDLHSDRDSSRGGTGKTRQDDVRSAERSAVTELEEAPPCLP